MQKNVIKMIKNNQFCTINIFGRIHRYFYIDKKNITKKILKKWNHENLGTGKLLCMNVCYESDVSNICQKII